MWLYEDMKNPQGRTRLAAGYQGSRGEDKNTNSPPRYLASLRPLHKRSFSFLYQSRKGKDKIRERGLDATAGNLKLERRRSRRSPGQYTPSQIYDPFKNPWRQKWQTTSPSTTTTENPTVVVSQNIDSSKRLKEFVKGLKLLPQIPRIDGKPTEIPLSRKTDILTYTSNVRLSSLNSPGTHRSSGYAMLLLSIILYIYIYVYIYIYICVYVYMYTVAYL